MVNFSHHAAENTPLLPLSLLIDDREQGEWVKSLLSASTFSMCIVALRGLDCESNSHLSTTSIDILHRARQQAACNSW